jgi:chlorobactene glucosyltransferase
MMSNQSLALTIAGYLSEQQSGILIFLCVLCFIAIFNWLTIRRLGTGLVPDHTPMVSILIPARNEALNIEECLVSLLSQDYEPYEVIVLDDESEDATADILARLSREYPALTVLPGLPLPSSWIGKNWACHQLSRAALGEWMLFVDADTRHHPRMLPETLAAAEASHADLVSGLPQQKMGTWGERLIVPVLAWALHTFFPIRLFQWLPFASLAVAVGQFLLFRREAYLQIGGHAAIRHSITDDFALTRLAKSKGLRWEFLNLSARVHCRMYRNFRQAFNGLSKNLFAVFDYNLPIFLFVWVWLAIAFIQPMFCLILIVLGITIPGFLPALALAAVFLSLIIWLTTCLSLRLPPYLALVYPLIIALAGTIAVRSAFYYYSRRSIDWKGRPIEPSRRQVDT